VLELIRFPFYHQFSEGLLESEIIKSAIELQTGDNPESIFQVLSNLSICIKYGKCELPNKHFK
jgi:hypothetical protein